MTIYQTKTCANCGKGKAKLAHIVKDGKIKAWIYAYKCNQCGFIEQIVKSEQEAIEYKKDTLFLKEGKGLSVSESKLLDFICKKCNLAFETLKLPKDGLCDLCRYSLKFENHVKETRIESNCLDKWLERVK